MDPHLERLQREIASAVADLSTEEWNRHPPGKWSAAEVLEHLYLTYTATTKGFERIAEGGNSLASAPTWKQRVQTVVVVGFRYLPFGREAPPVARPRGVPHEKVLIEIGLKITGMDDMIRRCEGKFGRRKKLLDHPILGPLTAGQWRKFHLVHGLHHVKQIRRLRESF